MNAPEALDLYNMACACAQMSALDDQAATADREKLQVRAVQLLRRAIEVNQVRYQALISGDRDFDPLRDRADYRDLMTDLRFPRDPFVQPSPISRAASETSGAGAGSPLLGD